MEIAVATEKEMVKAKRSNYNKIHIKWKITIQEEQTSTKLSTQPL